MHTCEKLCFFGLKANQMFVHPSKINFFGLKANQMFNPPYFYDEKWCFLWFFMKIFEKNHQKSKKIDFFARNNEFFDEKWGKKESF